MQFCAKVVVSTIEASTIKLKNMGLRVGMDDCVIICNDKEDLKQCLASMEQYVEQESCGASCCIILLGKKYISGTYENKVSCFLESGGYYLCI